MKFTLSYIRIVDSHDLYQRKIQRNEKKNILQVNTEGHTTISSYVWQLNTPPAMETTVSTPVGRTESPFKSLSSPNAQRQRMPDVVDV